MPVVLSCLTLLHSNIAEHSILGIDDNCCWVVAADCKRWPCCLAFVVVVITPGLTGSWQACSAATHLAARSSCCSRLWRSSIAISDARLCEMPSAVTCMPASCACSDPGTCDRTPVAGTCNNIEGVRKRIWCSMQSMHQAGAPACSLHENFSPVPRSPEGRAVQQGCQRASAWPKLAAAG
jgi:hypothetical protein